MGELIILFLHRGPLCLESNRVHAICRLLLLTLLELHSRWVCKMRSANFTNSYSSYVTTLVPFQRPITHLITITHCSCHSFFHRLFSLIEDLKDRELCVFFRNNHFSTMFKVCLCYCCQPAMSDAGRIVLFPMDQSVPCGLSLK
jgi:hypothetical protein